MDVSFPVCLCHVLVSTDNNKWLRSELRYDHGQRRLRLTQFKLQFTLVQVVFKRLYPKDYTPAVSTRVSNSMLVGLCFVHISPPMLCRRFPRLGAIIGQLFVGLLCDRFGRRIGLVFTALLVVFGATLGTAAHGAHGSATGLFWFLTFARGLTGIVRVGGLGYVLDLISLLPGCRR
jgi:hypothetical protein